MARSWKIAAFVCFLGMARAERVVMRLDGEERDAMGRVPEPAGATETLASAPKPESLAQSNRTHGQAPFKVGTRVLFWSNTQQGWTVGDNKNLYLSDKNNGFHTQIVRGVNEDGTYVLDMKAHAKAKYMQPALCLPDYCKINREGMAAMARLEDICERDGILSDKGMIACWGCRSDPCTRNCLEDCDDMPEYYCEKMSSGMSTLKDTPEARLHCSGCELPCWGKY